MTTVLRLLFSLPGKALPAQKPWIVPLPCTTKMHRLEENAGAASINLSDDNFKEMNGAVATVEVRGAWYPQHLQERTGK
ncbi:hypothetical protein [Parafilimonas sp.]|uniref:hypothetical protein n=1 Tax=Parafilimonas sp. TaxID=1969739 RepID=UPI0039E610B8